MCTFVCVCVRMRVSARGFSVYGMCRMPYGVVICERLREIDKGSRGGKRVENSFFGESTRQGCRVRHEAGVMQLGGKAEPDNGR